MTSTWQRQNHEEVTVMRSFVYVSMLVFAIACHHEKPATVATASPPPPKPEVKSEPKPQPAPQPVTPHLAVSDELAKRCTMHFANVQDAPKFDYDQFSLLPTDRDLLQQIAT